MLPARHTPFRLAGCGAALWLGLGAVAAGAGAAPAAVDDLFAATRPLVIAHRGFSAVAPENTLPSFRAALAAGADLVEFDYHVTRDGVPVVLHDRTLDRTTDAVARWGGKDLPVATRDWAGVAALDAGRWFDGRAGVRVPSLAEALDAIGAGGSVALIERKAGDAAALVEFLRRRGLVGRVVVQSFDWKFLGELHALLPSLALAALGPPHARLRADAAALPKGALDAAAWSELAEIGARALVWSTELSAEARAAARARGLRVWHYTIDDPAVARDLARRGADGIITNHPAAVRAALAPDR